MSDPDRTADRPATFREVLASGEFRAIYAAGALSWFGDYLARAAVTAMVFRQTGSVTASAATFAISYLPWLGIGPVLTALAERYPYRRVMVGCDLARMVLMGLVAVPDLPVPAMMLLLFATALLNPPFDASRSALLPRILDGDRYVVGLALNSTSFQFAQIMGYLAGGTLGAFSPRLAIGLNAASFGISAFLIGLGVHERAPAVARDNGTHLLRETADGFRIVFGTRVLRAIALIVFSVGLFTVVPEGLAAAWAAQLTGSVHDRGWIQGLIMTAYPVGFVLGGLIVNRLVQPTVRRRLIRPFAVLAPLALVPALSKPPVWIIVGICVICGFAMAGMLPAANGLFVQALPDGYRARAFGVVQTGVMLTQAVAVFSTGALADRFALPTVVGTWSLAGVVLVTAVSLSWPGAQRITEAIAAARAVNAGAAPDGAGPATSRASVARTRPGPRHAAAHRAGLNRAALNRAAPSRAAPNTAAPNNAAPNHAAAATPPGVDSRPSAVRPPGAHRRTSESQPGTSETQPGTSERQLSSSESQLSSSESQLSSSERQPGTSERQPGTSERQPRTDGGSSHLSAAKA